MEGITAYLGFELLELRLELLRALLLSLAAVLDVVHLELLVESLPLAPLVVVGPRCGWHRALGRGKR